MTTIHRLFSIGAAVALLGGLAAGCNVSTEGAEGRVLFTPDECGRVGCNFDSSIGVGGAIQVHIQSITGESLEGVDMISDDELVASTTPLGLVDGLETFGVVGVGAGVATLSVVDVDGVEIDFIQIGVQEVVAQRLDALAPGAELVTDVDEVYDEIWTLPAGTDATFLLTPLIGDDAPTMGVYNYAVSTTTPEILDHLDANSEEDIGTVRMTLPPGQFDLTFESDFLPPFSVLFDVP